MLYQVSSEKMKFLFVFAIVFVVAHAASVQEQWQEFKLKHGKTYKSLLEEKRRFAIFQEKLNKIEDHNQRYSKGEVAYYLGVNKFSDWTDEEFRATLSPMTTRVRSGLTYNDTKTSGAASLDYRDSGYVTEVKNQARCESCWAFSTVGSIEGQVAKKTGKLVSLSPQNLVDCSTVNSGCLGGDLDPAFQYVVENGVATEDAYPYTGYDGFCKSKGGQKISSYVDVTDSEAALLSALENVGPISIALDSTNLSPYAGGIFDQSSGCTSRVDHGVLLVGYGTENGRDYWLVKNSWGKNWGLDGYFKLIRGENACGITVDNAYPVL